MVDSAAAGNPLNSSRSGANAGEKRNEPTGSIVQVVRQRLGGAGLARVPPQLHPQGSR